LSGLFIDTAEHVGVVEDAIKNATMAIIRRAGVFDVNAVQETISNLPHRAQAVRVS